MERGRNARNSGIITKNPAFRKLHAGYFLGFDYHYLWSGMIGNRIKLKRIELGMTQEELGNRVGVTGQAIYRMEEGLVKHPRKLEPIASALSVRQEWLLTGSDDCANVLADDKIISDILSSLPYLTSSELREIARHVVQLANRNKSVLSELSNR